MKRLLLAVLPPLLALPLAAQGLFDGIAARRANARAAAETKFTREQLETAARAEGKVVWYAGTNPMHKTVVEAFSKRYPDVKVEAVYLGGPTVASRFLADKERGVEAADLFSSGLTEVYPELRERGYFADLRTLPSWETHPAWARDAKGAYAYFHVLRHCLAVNTELVPAAEIPKTYAELADARWKDRVALVDPDTGGMGIYFARFAAVNERLGFDWLARLRANGALLAYQSGQLIEAVASGRRPVGLSRDVEVDDASKAGAPVKCAWAVEGLPVQFTTIAVNRKAPNPHAARLFADWLLSADGKATLAKGGYGVPVGDSPTANNPGAWVLDVEAVSKKESRDFAAKASKALKGS